MAFTKPFIRSIYAGVGNTGRLEVRRNDGEISGSELISERDKTGSLEKRLGKHSPSLTILQRLARADRAAVQDCLDAYGAFIWALAKKHTYSSEEAEIMTEEIFIKIWKYAPRFDPNKCSERNFIASLVLRRLIRRSFELNLKQL